METTLEQVMSVATEKFNLMIENAKKGMVTSDDYTKFAQAQKAEIEKAAKEFTEKETAELRIKLDSLTQQLNAQSAKLLSLTEEKQTPKAGGFVGVIKRFLNEVVTEYAKDARGNSKKMNFDANEIHKTVSITSDYTGGTALITQDMGRLIVEPDRPLNLRDIMSIERTSQSYVAFNKVTNFVWAVDMKAENDTLGESSFDVVESAVQAKRIGTFIDISKNMLKDVPRLESVIMNKAQKQLRYREDDQILNGDGVGNRIDGLLKNARTFDLTPNTYAGGAFATVATYKAGAWSLITFAAAHNLSSGYKLTIANSSNYNGTYNVIVISQTQVLIEKAYNAETATGWTGTGIHPEYLNVDNANEADVLSVAISTMATLWYKVTGIVLNPLMANHIKNLLKGTDAHYLINRGLDMTNGVLYINGAPVVETDAIGYNRFLIGDFREAVALVDYQDAEIYIKDDVSYAKANKVAIIVEEQVAMPIYNALFFMTGDFATAKEELETAS